MAANTGDPHRVGDRDRERLVDGVHDLPDERLDRRSGRLRDRRQDLLAEIDPDVGQLALGGRIDAARSRRSSAVARRARPAARGTWFVNVLPKIVPAIASPTDPPTWRKKVSELVAAPSIRGATALWTTIVKIGEGRSDAEARRGTSRARRAATGVSAVIPVRKKRPMTEVSDRADRHPLVAARAGDDLPGQHGAAQDAHHQRQHLVAGVVALEPSTNWNQRGMKMMAPKKPKVIRKVADDRSGHGPVAEQLERDDRLDRSRLDPHEDGAEHQPERR